ncbi:hypothetical protein V7U47_11725, partial [Segatella copri]|uniref:hypothetical protein n=1 Tax=Segatella copri TaxID=165179 RepID=UPI002FEF9166
TLLTETITIAAIAAKTNFFIILSILNCYYLLLFSLFWNSLSNPLFMVATCMPKDNRKVDVLDIQRLIACVP